MGFDIGLVSPRQEPISRKPNDLEPMAVPPLAFDAAARPADIPVTLEGDDAAQQMAAPFDAAALAARYIHPRVCDEEHDFDEADCLVAQAAVRDLLDELRDAGLALVPLLSVGWLERAFDELVGQPVATEPDGDAILIEQQADDPIEGDLSEAPWYYLQLHHRPVRIRRRLADGSFDWSDLMPHYHAVLELTLLNREHGPEIVGATIESEPQWIEGLLRDLPDIGGAAA